MKRGHNVFDGRYIVFSMMGFMLLLAMVMVSGISIPSNPSIVTFACRWVAKQPLGTIARDLFVAALKH